MTRTSTTTTTTRTSEDAANLAALAARGIRTVAAPWTVAGKVEPQPLAADFRATFERQDWRADS